MLRIDDRLGPGLLELVKIVSLDPPEIARAGPSAFPIRRWGIFHIPHDRTEAMRPEDAR